jgi:hypothetical protein
MKGSLLPMPSPELFRHVNVDDVDIGGMHHGNSVLDGGVEGIHCVVDCFDDGRVRGSLW